MILKFYSIKFDTMNPQKKKPWLREPVNVWLIVYLSSWNRFWLKTDSPAKPEKVWESLAQLPDILVGWFSRGQCVPEDNPGGLLLAGMSSEIVIWNGALSVLERTQSHRSALEWVWSPASGDSWGQGQAFQGLFVLRGTLCSPSAQTELS